MDDHIPAPPPFGGGPTTGGRPASRSPLQAAWRDPKRRTLLSIAGIGLLTLLLIALVARGRDGVAGARSDLKESAELVRDRERDVAKAQQELEERLADLQTARAEMQASAVKLNAEVSKERRDVRDTMVVGGEVSMPGEVEANAQAALRRSEAATEGVRRP